jgi:peptidoglycan/xylan/chitin deacetylase (PgdA/CDA1 family)
LRRRAGTRRAKSKIVGMPSNATFSCALAATLRSALGAILLCLLPWLATAETVALTFDDGFDPRTEPRAALWNAHLLDTLAQHHVRAMFFPEGQVVDSPEGLALVRAWGAAGHAIGNHTYTHQSYSSAASPQSFMEDVLREQTLVNTMPGWCPRLRLPYLDEGNSAERHEQLLALLAAHGYGVAPATITIDDWNHDQRFMETANRDPTLDVGPYRKAYLGRLWQEAVKQVAEWRQRLGRSPPHVLLLHANGLNAVMLPDILAMFEAGGWTFVDPIQAFTDPIYQRGYPNGGSPAALPVPACR